MTTVVNVHEAKTHLSRLLEAVAAGAGVVIASAGKPVARLVPIEKPPKPKQLGQLRGRRKVPDEWPGRRRFTATRSTACSPMTPCARATATSSRWRDQVTTAATARPPP